MPAQRLRIWEKAAAMSSKGNATLFSPKPVSGHAEHSVRREGRGWVHFITNQKPDPIEGKITVEDHMVMVNTGKSEITLPATSVLYIQWEN